MAILSLALAPFQTPGRIQSPQAQLTARSLDSIRTAAETTLRHSADSIQRSVEQRAHVVHDEALIRYNEMATVSATWLGIFIAALGVLFAIGAVVAGFLLWRQGREFKQERERLFEDTRAELDQVIADRNAAFNEFKESIERRANELLSTTQAPTATGATAATTGASVSQQALDELKTDIRRLEEVSSRFIDLPASVDSRAKKIRSTYIIKGVSEAELTAAMKEFTAKNERMTWAMAKLSDDQLVLRSSYLIDTKGGEELRDFLEFRFLDREVRRVLDTKAVRAVPPEQAGR